MNPFFWGIIADMVEQDQENTIPTPISSSHEETQPVNTGAKLPSDEEVTQAFAVTPALSDQAEGSQAATQAMRASSGAPVDSGATQGMRTQSGVVPPVIPPVVPPATPAAQKPERKRRWLLFLAGILLVILLGGVGSYFGYQSALELRIQKQQQASLTKATEYYLRGVQAQKDKNYDLARRYFEATIKLDPQFPGAAQGLTESLMAQMATATPTPVTPTVTPTEILPTATPDVRSQDDKLNEARQLYAAKDWDKLFVTIDSLRTIDPNYHSVEVDGMLFMALRFRGISKIYQSANLEGGLYDLALAERISPLDREALGARNAARMYLNAIAFWGVDWPKVIDLLEQAAAAMPNMRDASGQTASQRYQGALSTQASVLMGSEKYCDAEKAYGKALNAGINALAPKATEAYEKCHPATQTPLPTGSPTPTATGAATDTPAPAGATDTPAPAAPTNTPAPASATNTPAPVEPTATKKP